MFIKASIGTSTYSGIRCLSIYLFMYTSIKDSIGTRTYPFMRFPIDFSLHFHNMSNGDSIGNFNMESFRFRLALFSVRLFYTSRVHSPDWKLLWNHFLKWFNWLDDILSHWQTNRQTDKKTDGQMTHGLAVTHTGGLKEWLVEWKTGCHVGHMDRQTDKETDGQTTRGSTARRAGGLTEWLVEWLTGYHIDKQTKRPTGISKTNKTIGFTMLSCKTIAKPMENKKKTKKIKKNIRPN